ncbi:hypothetical protein L0663_04940 [Dyadobacter sp. CY107]|uniref:hypothetical protein n=1 Tax=Dyadobacter fanqingshengii TaxID=2906443 RepID=UPI001F185350|nr:hypothetical protein [Dyadobacter fanqingshengii]MCF2502712.1 hypothetical protein [Dyadobacter fanqingshengii]
MTWNSSVTFPSSGVSNVPMTISKDFFFLQVKNNSVRNINHVLVNYQLQSGTTEGLLIPNDQYIYNLEYYKAYSNSNVRLENTEATWHWQFESSHLKLPFTQNQSATSNAN